MDTEGGDGQTNGRSILVSSALITANWSTYTYAIVTNQTLEASLGYFMNPLVSVLLGTVFLKEKLNKAQTLAILFACAGVMWVTFKQGEFPALGLTLALSFGFYGLVRKWRLSAALRD